LTSKPSYNGEFVSILRFSNSLASVEKDLLASMASSLSCSNIISEEREYIVKPCSDFHEDTNFFNRRSEEIRISTEERLLVMEERLEAIDDTCEWGVSE